jgi:hypothetical protein
MAEEPPVPKMFAVAAALACLVIGLGNAEPPPSGSEQESILAPHGSWIRSLLNPYTRQACCDVSDCRAVPARTRGGNYQAFIGRKDYGEDAPDQWLDVPNEVVLHERRNPVGLPIACWKASRRPLFNGFFCFQNGLET